MKCLDHIVSNCVRNSIYDSSRLCNSLLNLGSAILGLRSTVGMTDFSTVRTIPGTSDKTICQVLQGEYVCLVEFLQNYTVNNTEVQEIQSYVDSSGNVAYKNKRQKRLVHSFNTWLEAWHNYERLDCHFMDIICMM